MGGMKPPQDSEYDGGETADDAPGHVLPKLKPR